MSPSRMQFASVVTRTREGTRSQLATVSIKTASRSGLAVFIFGPEEFQGDLSAAESLVTSIGYELTGPWQPAAVGWVAWCDRKSTPEARFFEGVHSTPAVGSDQFLSGEIIPVSVSA